MRHDNSQRNQGNSRFSPFVVSLLGLSSPVSLLVSLVVQLVIISHPLPSAPRREPAGGSPATRVTATRTLRFPLRGVWLER